MNKLEFDNVLKFAKLEYEMYIKPLEEHKELNPEQAFEKILFLLNRLTKRKGEDRDISLTPLLIALMSICGVALKNINPDIIYEFSKIHFGIPSPIIRDNVSSINPIEINCCSQCARIPEVYKKSENPTDRNYAVRCYHCHVTTIPCSSISKAIECWNKKQVWVEVNI